MINQEDRDKDKPQQSKELQNNDQQDKYDEHKEIGSVEEDPNQKEQHDERKVNVDKKEYEEQEIKQDEKNKHFNDVQQKKEHNEQEEDVWKDKKKVNRRQRDNRSNVLIQQDGKERKQIRKLRRIVEGQQPTDENKLIEYLIQRINQAQEILQETQQVLQEQIKQKQKISQNIRERNKQLKKLNQLEQKGLSQRIKIKLTQILNESIEQKLKIDEILKIEQNKYYQYKNIYNELNIMNRNLQNLKIENNSKETGLINQIYHLQLKIKQYQQNIENQKLLLNSIIKNKDYSQNQFLQLKIAFDKMNDIRAVLNRFFGNDDLFDDTMNLKPQKTRKVHIMPQSLPRKLPSRKFGRNSITKLKPIAMRKQREDDDDFWKGDFSKNRQNF